MSDRRFDFLLCDSDDTLLDFCAACRQAVYETLTELGVSSDPDAAYSIFRPITDTMWKRLERGEITRDTLFTERSKLFAETIGAHFEPDAFNAAYRKHLRETRFVLPGAIEMLKKVRALGVSTYIITNADAFCASGRLQPLEPYVNGAFVSESIGSYKPSAEFFEYVHSAIGCPDKRRVLVFGDSETSDITGGAAFGFKTCLYDPTGKRLTAADYRVSRHEQLAELLLNV